MRHAGPPTRPPHVLLALSMAAEYGRGIAIGVGRYCRSNEPWITELIGNGGAAYVTEQIHVRNADALIWQVGMEQGPRELMPPVPTVNVSGRMIAGLDHHVRVSESALAKMAVEHLHERGIRNYAYVCWGNPRHSTAETSTRRGNAFREAVEAVGCSCAWFELSETEERDVQLQRLQPWLAEMPRPVGVLGFNDETALVVVSACRSAGLRVPEDVAVLGVDDDTPRCELSHPPLSSVQMPTDRIGFEAAKMLDQLMQGQKPEHTDIALPPLGVVLRQSTDVFAVEDPYVAEALVFIRDHVAEPMTVADVVRAVPVNRRWLERRFHRYLGRSPADEIRRVRVEAARRLLAETDLPMPDIARRCGFPTQARLSQAFKKAVGRSPRAYRRTIRVDESAHLSEISL